MSDDSDNADKNDKLESLEKRVKELGPSVADFVDDMKPYLGAVANVPVKVPVHRMEPTVAVKYLELGHDIRSQEIQLESKKDQEITKRQELAQQHESTLQKRVLAASLAERVLVLLTAVALAYFGQGELAAAALVWALTRGWSRDKVPPPALPPSPDKRALNRGDE